MASENIKQRKIYRICSDAANKIWDRIYFLTNAASVDANDGLDMETKVGAVKGITTSTNVTEKGYAADATVVKELNDSLAGVSFEVDPVSGIITGYKTKIGGADSVHPFSGNYEEYKVRVNNNSKKQSTLADGTILSDNSGILVTMTDNYLFTALKSCKAIIYHYGHTYDSKNTKVCIVNDIEVNTTTDIVTRFIQTLETGDTMYLARTNSAGYYSENAAYLRFEPV